jgi:hypothetical protein
MKALSVLVLFLTPFVVIGVLGKRFLKRRMEDVDISNVREQAGTQNRKRRVSFFGRIRD